VQDKKPSTPIEKRRERHNILFGQLKTDRSSYENFWQEADTFILPGRYRPNTTDGNRGERKDSAIIDSTATTSATILESGMMGGLTDPASDWFGLSVPNPALAESAEVKDWLHAVKLDMRNILLKSGLYKALPAFYGDTGTFATGAMFAEEDMESVVNFQHLELGSYFLGINKQRKTCVFAREFQYTVRQVLEHFGNAPVGTEDYDWNYLSPKIKTAWETGKLEDKIDICHIIEPNSRFNPMSPLSIHKRFSSSYYEKGVTDRYLEEKGYDIFPAIAGKWFTTGSDAYGTSCPGKRAMGDIKQLQKGEKKSLTAVDKMIDPPMQGPTSIADLGMLPGSYTAVDTPQGQDRATPVHAVNLKLEALEAKQEQCRGRIRKVFHEDLFLRVSNDGRSGITAREIEEIVTERMVVISPVLTQMYEALDQIIDIVFQFMVKQRRIPKPPDAIQGMELKVEYTSYLAQAQKARGLGAVQRTLGVIGQLAQFDPRVLHKLDADQTVDIIADMTGAPPSMIRSDEVVAKIRAAEAKAQQAQQQQAAAQQMIQGARDLSQTDMSGENALTKLVGIKGGKA
jgi:hypothetical protein